MKALTTVTKISKELKPKLTCNIFGKVDVKIKARGLFQYMGFTFITAKDGKHWHCYEFTSGCTTVQFCGSEAEAIRQTKHKIDIHCKNSCNFRLMVRIEILKSGFAPQARYTNLLPKTIHAIN